MRTRSTKTHAVTRSRLAQSWHWMWVAVTAISILSFYIHTVHESVLRGESLRTSQRIADKVTVATTRHADDPFGQLALGTIP